MNILFIKHFFVIFMVSEIPILCPYSVTLPYIFKGWFRIVQHKLTLFAHKIRLFHNQLYHNHIYYKSIDVFIRLFVYAWRSYSIWEIYKVVIV